MISSYKKNTDGVHHQHSREDWTAALRERRDTFLDAARAEKFVQPRIPEGTIIGDSLVRYLTRIQAHWQVGVLSFSVAAMPRMLASLQMLEMGKIYTVTLMMGTNDVSRGESRKMTRLQDKVSCILEELRIYLEPAILTICTVPYNMMADQNAREMNGMRNINEINRQIQQRSLLPMRVLDVARMMEDSLPEDASSDGIHFDRPRGTEWLNGVLQRHINFLESVLVETGQFTFGPPPISPFFLARPVECPGEASRTQYLERVKDLDLEDLACRQELTEDLSNHYCVDWLKAHEAHFSRTKTLETANLT